MRLPLAGSDPLTLFPCLLLDGLVSQRVRQMQIAETRTCKQQSLDWDALSCCECRMHEDSPVRYVNGEEGRFVAFDPHIYLGVLPPEEKYTIPTTTTACLRCARTVPECLTISQQLKTTPR